MVTLGDSVRKTIDELAKIAYYRHLLTALLSCSVVSFVFTSKSCGGQGTHYFLISAVLDEKGLLLV